LEGRAVWCGLHDYFIYILTNRSGTLYIGVTDELPRRLSEHRQRVVSGFTSKYQLSRLIYVEVSSDQTAAFARERQLKKWSRAKKVRLIEAQNPKWIDLADEFLAATPEEQGAPERWAHTTRRGLRRRD
jgi:putative endonuclease